MLVAAIDTTARAGSYALVRDGRLLAVQPGDADRPHAERLPAALVDLLDSQGLALADVDVFAVAAGPGSFTGLRIGIATIQGLALAMGKPAVGISALDALAHAALAGFDPPPARLAAWMDAQRGEVFAASYLCERTRPEGTRLELADGPLVAAPGLVLARWRERGFATGPFVGDGALAYRAEIEAESSMTIVEPVPPLAPQVAALALAQVSAGGTLSPHAISPIYVRRPDAELARARRPEPS